MQAHIRIARHLTILITLAAGAATLHAQITPLPHDQGAVGLGLALRHLPVEGRVLMVTAHPDDENNGLLVKLQRGLGIKAALLTVTRGDGGQNEIGPELFQAIGILRSEELARVHEYDGVEQFHTRAFEFGYSFSVEETFEKWGREEILRDVVRVVRTVRPDVIVTMSREGSGGGQHHMASARLGAEAMRAAADPTRFPEQIAEGLRAWQARKVYESAGGRNQPGPAGTVRCDTSAYDPLLGMSWNQFGALARMAHRCQGMGQLVSRPGSGAASYRLVDSEPRVTGEEQDILDGIDTSPRRLLAIVKGQEAAVPSLAAALDTIEREARRASDLYDTRATEKTLPPLVAGLAAVRTITDTVRGSRLDGDARAELLWRLERKEQDFVRALGLAQGLVLHATVDDGNVVRGQTFNVTAAVWNLGADPVAIDDVSLLVPAGWTARRVEGQPGRLAHNESLTMTYAVTVGSDAHYTQPYWTFNPKVDRYDIEIPEHHTQPWSPPDVVAEVRYTAGGASAAMHQAAYYRYEGPWVGGEKQKIVNVVPALSVELTPAIAVVPIASGGQTKEFRVRVLNNAKEAGTATVRLEAPARWSVAPPDVALDFRLEEEALTARFVVTPPAQLADGEYEVRAVASRGGQAFREGYQVIAYDHIQTRHLYHPAVSRVKTLDVALGPNVAVGYIMGSGDEVPAAIEQLGAPLTMLTPDEVAFADLSRFSTIVTGIRAYEKRPDLRAYNQRLLDFARDGGHLVVQYNKTDFNRLMAGGSEGFGFGAPEPDTSPFTPYPGVITRNRITVEEAPVTILEAASVEMTRPNRITDRDFDGWVQERGLYFFGAKDPRYTELLASTEPWPNNPGRKVGLLTVAQVGKGTWTYVGLGLWRQLPAGTPGAYRILANLLSRPRVPTTSQ